MGCEPGFELMRARAAEGVSAHDFFTMVPGQSLFLDEPATADIAQILPAETEIYLKHALTGPNTADDRILKSTSLSGKPIGIQ